MNKAEIQHEEFKRTGKEPSDGWENYEGACGLYATMYLFDSKLDQAEYQKSKTDYGRMSDIITIFTDKASRNWHVFNSGGRLSLENVALSENTDGSGSMITLGYYDDPKNTYTIVEKKPNGEKNLIYSFTKTILSTIEYADNSADENALLEFSGKLLSFNRPSPEINYDSQLNLDTPYFDELNAQGPRNITSIVVVPENESIRQRLASNIGNAVSIEGVIEWGLAETRHLKANKIVVTPDN